MLNAIHQVDGLHPLLSSNKLDQFINNFKLKIRPSQWVSGLTGCGYPLELSFTTLSSQPRFTLDPFCAHLNPHARTGATIELLKNCFDVKVDLRDLGKFERILAKSPSYGAWLGLREVDQEVQCKLYLETETTALCDVPGPSTQLSDGHLVMVGFTPQQRSMQSPGIELYYRCQRLSTANFSALLRPLNLGCRHQPDVIKLTSQFSRIYGHIPNDRLPGGSSGFSYTLDNNGNATSLTLFLFCRSLFGRDRTTRSEFSKLMQQQGIDASIYRDYTLPSLTNATALTQHGMFAITVANQGELVYSVGYCPKRGRHDRD